MLQLTTVDAKVIACETTGISCDVARSMDTLGNEESRESLKAEAANQEKEVQGEADNICQALSAINGDAIITDRKIGALRPVTSAGCTR